MIILPRQARDKHRENSKRDAFSHSGSATPPHRSTSNSSAAMLADDLTSLTEYAASVVSDTSRTYGTRVLMMRLARAKDAKDPQQFMDQALSDLSSLLLEYWTNNGVVSALTLTMAFPATLAKMEVRKRCF
jgi:hypothetical protein